MRETQQRMFLATADCRTASMACSTTSRRVKHVKLEMHPSRDDATHIEQIIDDLCLDAHVASID